MSVKYLKPLHFGDSTWHWDEEVCTMSRDSFEKYFLYENPDMAKEGKCWAHVIPNSYAEEVHEYISNTDAFKAAQAIAPPLLVWEKVPGHPERLRIECRPDHPAKPKLWVQQEKEHAQVGMSIDTDIIFLVNVLDRPSIEDVVQEGKEIGSALYWSWLRLKRERDDE
jgi:hypothetical protein